MDGWHYRQALLILALLGALAAWPASASSRGAEPARPAAAVTAAGHAAPVIAASGPHGIGGASTADCASATPPYLVSFGGYDSNGDTHNDTWTTDDGGASWDQVIANGVAGSPPARAFAGMAYTSNPDRVILFGGNTRSGTDLSDLWVWDCYSETWTQLNCPGGPSARHSAKFVYDPDTDKFLLQGGFNGAKYTDDTWSLDTSTNPPTWTQLDPKKAPPPRDPPGMVYDSATGTAILFGGDGIQNTTWSFSAGAWTQLISPGCTSACPNSPSARGDAGMAYDAASGTVLLFGGEGFSILNDTWSFTGSAWSKLTPAASPSPRYSMGMAFDTGSNLMLLFGGEDANGNDLNDTWFWNGTNWNTAATPPAVLFLDPANDQQAGGANATIGGTGLSAATAVSFGGTPATSFLVASDNNIQAVAPAGPAGAANTAVDLRVTTGLGTSAINQPGDQYVYYAPPTVTSVGPSTGGGNTTVTISGTNFSTALGATDVNFVPSGGSPVGGERGQHYHLQQRDAVHGHGSCREPGHRRRAGDVLRPDERRERGRPVPVHAEAGRRQRRRQRHGGRRALRAAYGGEPARHGQLPHSAARQPDHRQRRDECQRPHLGGRPLHPARRGRPARHVELPADHGAVRRGSRP